MVVVEESMQAPGVAPAIPRGDAFDDAASAVLGDAGAELQRGGDARGPTWALLRACGAEGACHRVEHAPAMEPAPNQLAEMWPGFDRHLGEIWPRLGRDLAQTSTGAYVAGLTGIS
jgi:hypothetical protein